MSFSSSNLISLNNFSINDVEFFFEKTKEFSDKLIKNTTALKEKHKGKILQQIFLENSTRTSSSFEIAAKRMGMEVANFSASTSSLSKGESLTETVTTLSLMGPDIIVYRGSSEHQMADFLVNLPQPVINAGLGQESHPTQALLDAYTINSHFSKISDLKILFVGDVKHSRVFRSHFNLLSKFNNQFAVCGPEELLTNMAEVENFSDFKKALAWADVCIFLRTQSERHKDDSVKSDLVRKISGSYQLNKVSIENISDKSIVLHPGPFNEGVEIKSEILKDKRVKIHQQVTNGVLVRMAAIDILLEARGK